MAESLRRSSRALHARRGRHRAAAAGLRARAGLHGLRTAGAPDELIEVPPEMRTRSEDENLEWRAIACHASQPALSAISAGYLRAFVNRREFFWTTKVDG